MCSALFVVKNVVSKTFNCLRYPFEGMAVHPVLDYYVWVVGGIIVFTRQKRFLDSMRLIEDLFMEWEQLGKGKHQPRDSVESWTCLLHQNQRLTVSTTKHCSKHPNLWQIRPWMMPKKKFIIWMVKIWMNFQTVGFLVMELGKKGDIHHWMAVLQYCPLIPANALMSKYWAKSVRPVKGMSPAMTCKQSRSGN